MMFSQKRTRSKSLSCSDQKVIPKRTPRTRRNLEKQQRKHLECRLFVTFVVSILLIGLVQGQYIDTINFAFKDIPQQFQNPLTGFYRFGPVQNQNVPMQPETFPASLEFLAVPLKSVVTGPGSYSWTRFEQDLSTVARNGRQAVVRFYVDYPGLPSGIPDFLMRGGLSARPYSENGNCASCSLLPDYSNKRLVDTLIGFIRVFGAQYNGDKRIGIVQLGLVGFWGEWHTWPLQYNAQTFPSTPVLSNIIKTYRTAFPDTLLQIGINVASLPVYNAHNEAAYLKNLSIGYSDDSIMSSYYDSFIKPILERSNTTLTYTTGIIGGEIFPPVQHCLLRSPSCVGSTQFLLETLKTYRASVALFQRLFDGPLSPNEIRVAQILAKSMGYRFYISRVRVSISSGTTRLDVTVTNNGMTKCYFDLYLGLDMDHTSYFVTDRLHEVLPNVSRTFIMNIPVTRNVSRTMLPFRARFFLHAPLKVMPRQYLYLSNDGINNNGDLYFIINPMKNTV